MKIINKIIAAALSLSTLCTFTTAYSSAANIPEQIIIGDANADDTFNIADVATLQNWLLGKGELTNWANADLCRDGKIDIFDLLEMKNKLLKNIIFGFLEDCYIEPEIYESEVFEFHSPDGSQCFYVKQTAEKYAGMDGNTSLQFYTNFDHFNSLQTLNISSPYEPYMPFSTAETYEIIWSDSDVTFNFTADKDYSFTFDLIDTSVREQTLTVPINNKEKPEITSVDFTADCAGGLNYRAKVNDYYRIDVMTSGTVGLVGTPINIDFGENVSPKNAVFHYNENELRWVKEENLIVLCYDSSRQTFRQVYADIDTEADTVSFDVEKSAIYLLVDADEWFNYWGKDTTEFKKKVNVLAYPSDWERGYNTGDIMNLCDKDWAVANAPDFRVSTPEQLASVVWYVNASGFRCSVTLENDIDLSGYDWVSMGYRPMSFIGNVFRGTIDGNGFAIKNMNLIATFSEVGFIGNGFAEVRNIRFENASIKGGRNVGIVCGNGQESTFTNVSVSGNIETSSDYVGAIVAAGNYTLTDCSADVTLNGNSYPYLSLKDKQTANAQIIEKYEISIDEDFVLTRPDSDATALGWEFYIDGKRILSRNALGSNDCDIKSISLFQKYSGKECTVYLIEPNYARASNIITFIVP